jgi:hypothetical protein
VPGQGLLLAECVFAELAAEVRLLVSWQFLPVLSDELASLNSTELAEFGLLVVADNLDQSVERARLGVVRLVQCRCGGLDTVRIGCCV